MLISFFVSQLLFLRTTAVSATSMTVGNRKFPLVQRLAANLSTGMPYPSQGTTKKEEEVADTDDGYLLPVTMQATPCCGRIDAMPSNAADRGRAYWDRHARRYDAFMRVVGRPLPRALALVQEETRSLDRVLEVAAGTGLFTVAIARSAARVVASDYSDAMLHLLQARLERDGLRNVECVARDLYALGYERGTFDAVVCANVLHLVPDLPRALSSLRSVLRARGKIIAPTFVHAETLFSRAASRVFSLTGFPGARRLTTAELAASIAAAGFDVRRSETIPGLIPIGFVVGAASTS